MVPLSFQAFQRARLNHMTGIAPITTVLATQAGLQGRPLVVLMHGYGADERDLLGMLVELGIGTSDERFDWISVRAPHAASDRGYAWFPLDEVTKVGIADATLDTDAIDASCAALVALLDDLAPDTPIIPIGFSQGAVMAGELLRAIPERVAAAVLCSGFVVPDSGAEDARLASLQRPVFFGWGDRDESPIPQEAFPMSAQWLGAHAVCTAKEYPGMTHAISAEELTDIREFLAGLPLIASDEPQDDLDEAADD